MWCRQETRNQSRLATNSSSKVCPSTGSTKTSSPTSPSSAPSSAAKFQLMAPILLEATASLRWTQRLTRKRPSQRRAINLSRLKKSPLTKTSNLSFVSTIPHSKDQVVASLHALRTSTSRTSPLKKAANLLTISWEICSHLLASCKVSWSCATRTESQSSLALFASRRAKMLKKHSTTFQLPKRTLPTQPTSSLLCTFVKPRPKSKDVLSLQRAPTSSNAACSRWISLCETLPLNAPKKSFKTSLKTSERLKASNLYLKQMLALCASLIVKVLKVPRRATVCSFMIERWLLLSVSLRSSVKSILKRHGIVASMKSRDSKSTSQTIKTCFLWSLPLVFWWASWTTTKVAGKEAIKWTWILVDTKIQMAWQEWPIAKATLNSRMAILSRTKISTTNKMAHHLRLLLVWVWALLFLFNSRCLNLCSSTTGTTKDQQVPLSQFHRWCPKFR